MIKECHRCERWTQPIVVDICGYLAQRQTQQDIDLWKKILLFKYVTIHTKQMGTRRFTMDIKKILCYTKTKTAMGTYTMTDNKPQDTFHFVVKKQCLLRGHRFHSIVIRLLLMSTKPFGIFNQLFFWTTQMMPACFL